MRIVDQGQLAVVFFNGHGINGIVDGGAVRQRCLCLGCAAQHFKSAHWEHQGTEGVDLEVRVRMDDMADLIALDGTFTGNEFRISHAQKRIWTGASWAFPDAAILQHQPGEPGGTWWGDWVELLVGETLDDLEPGFGLFTMDPYIGAVGDWDLSAAKVHGVPISF